MIFCFLIYDMGINNNIYIIVGTIISICVLFLLYKKSIYGYIGTVFFYGIQIFGTEVIFENFRYGLIFRTQSDGSLNDTTFQLDFNYTAIILVILAILGAFRHIKLTEQKKYLDK